VTEFARVAVASRTFALAAILGLALAFNERAAVGVTIAVLVIAAIASYIAHVSALPNHWVLAGEAAVVGLVAVSTLPDSVVLLPYLVVLPLLSGLARGASGASLVIGAQVTTMLVTAAIHGGSTPWESRAEFLAPWMVTIVGAGLIGASTKRLGKSPAGTSLDETYDAARRLLGQLRTLARRLPAGLDPITVTNQILEQVRQRAGCSRAAVFSRSESGVFVPLAYLGPGAQDTLHPTDPAIAQCWRQGRAVVTMVADASPSRIRSVVAPVRLGTEVVAVVAGHTTDEISESQLETLQQELDKTSLRLATSLAFSEVRNLVTADERQRLAREIHDGVAQEVASLGYVVDELAATSSDPEVATGLKELRHELTRVVTELRLSIFDLRSDVGNGPSLGSALSDYVRTVGSRSNMRVHLTLDEAPARLSPDAEAELFRIAQEAITNARKHSEAENLWVDCWVRPPAAFIRVRDDGRGLRPGRSDSYGLRIMRERADRIDADVIVEQDHVNPGRPGTCVTISLGSADVQNMQGVSAAS
jgi:signal transduction histidine kinase